MKKVLQLAFAIWLGLMCSILPSHAKTSSQVSFSGIASYYGGLHHGKKTANGERFDMHGLSAAHRKLPFGTQLKVTNLTNGKSVIVRVNDRGPFHPGRILDVSQGAARQLGMVKQGTARVSVNVLPKTKLTEY